ncbi:RxLR effector protein [Phytophthora megakarya]|uniref:RxLR effector protein n=1 Tax=Phytophthora megakarya TaxID=4795 RepID=A0A225VEQ6_9STRA|nr:RxLR effector protein [Phytophthora megakarya]
MRRQHVFLTAIIILVASCGVTAVPNSKTISADPSASVELIKPQHHKSVKRYLRTSDVAADDEERGTGFKDAVAKVVEKVRVNALKVKIPYWIVTGKDGPQVQKALGMAGVYPLITHKNWKVLTAFDNVNDKVQKSLYPAGK